MKLISQITPKRLLVTSPHNIGDLIAKTAFLQILKQHFPHCHIIVMARAYVAPMVSMMPFIDQYLDFTSFFSHSDSDIITNLKNLNIDTLVHVLSRESSIGPDVIQLAKQAKIPIRVGNRQRSRLKNFLNKKGLTHNLRKKRIIENMHEYLWHLQLLPFFGLSHTYTIEQIQKIMTLSPPNPCVDKLRQWIDPNRFNLIIHPGSHGNAKEWPQDYFMELITKLTGHMNIILTGSSDEENRFKSLANNSDIRNTMGRLELKELLQLISLSDGLLAASTGPAHMAGLFSKKTLALFPKQAAMSSAIWGSVGKQSINISSRVICHPCRKKLTDFDPNLCECMKAISVGQVESIIRGWL